MRHVLSRMIVTAAGGLVTDPAVADELWIEPLFYQSASGGNPQADFEKGADLLGQYVVLLWPKNGRLTTDAGETSDLGQLRQGPTDDVEGSVGNLVGGAGRHGTSITSLARGNAQGLDAGHDICT